jgi:hypothetical protein
MEARGGSIELFESNMGRNTRVKIFQIGFLFFFCSFHQISWAADFKDISGGKKFVIGKNGKGKNVSVQIRMMPFSKLYPKQNDSYPNFGFYGVGYFQPKYSVANLKVWAGDDEIGIPLSAYLDLTVLNSINLDVKDNKTFTVTILGGDAADSYCVDLLFKNNRLVKRTVISGEDPDIVLEETNYIEH